MGLLTKASYSAEVTEREIKNREVAYRAALEAAVLLKNEQVLPLKRKQKVAMYGAGVSMTVKGGTGSGEVNERHSVTILEGMESRGFEVTTKQWIADFEKGFAAEEAVFGRMQTKALLSLNVKRIQELVFQKYYGYTGRDITPQDIMDSATDTCIYVLSRQAGEGADRKTEAGSYFITETEKKAISFCAKNYKKFLLVINSGCSIDMSFTEEIKGIGAIMFICQLGMEGGNAFADILLGTVSPSGKLTDTWANQYEDFPYANEYSYLSGNPDNSCYKEGIYVGYRYFDTFEKKVRYPFGYGLSYTGFSMKTGRCRTVGTKVEITVKVTNTGDTHAGKEVVQVYLSAPQGKLAKEYQSLVAFKKTKLLAPGESENVTVVFDMADFGSYDEESSSYILEGGYYAVRVGNSSRTTEVACSVILPETVVLSKHEAICLPQTEIHELTPEKRSEEVLPDGLRLYLPAAVFKTVVHTYKTPEICQEERVQALLNTLTKKEMADLLVGIGMFGGKTGFTLPGSVGNTTSKLWNKGLANMTLCDGPAGLRIQRRSTVTKREKVKAVDLSMSVFEKFPRWIQKLILGNPEKEPVLYQYTTAFPVTAALAQTWNEELLYEVGEAVFAEMKEYGCTYWLAPAINIHRNPLCGRNFEYFSEDPFLTGHLAAALTKGVQQEEGYYVTVKHFACNNQENNRMKSSSNLGERTLREIYLRAFERTVKEGGAKSVMTSYNLINGTYTPDSYDLCTRVLRNEWGFDGVVMTDWYSTGRGKGDNALAIRAGNDLIMPGGKWYAKRILSGLVCGKVTEEEMRRACANIIKATFSSAIQKEYIDEK